MSYMERSSDPHGRRKLYSQHFSAPGQYNGPDCGMVLKEIDTDRSVFVVPLCLNRMNWLDVVMSTDRLRESYEPYNPRHMWNTPAQ